MCLLCHCVSLLTAPVVLRVSLCVLAQTSLRVLALGWFLQALLLVAFGIRLLMFILITPSSSHVLVVTLRVLVSRLFLRRSVFFSFYFILLNMALSVLKFRAGVWSN